jgi:Flp pilus assembly protein TadD
MSQMQRFDDLLNEGAEHIGNHNFAAALETASRLKALDPDSADGFHLAAIAHQYQYQWTESLAELDKAVLNAPYDAGLYSLRGFAYMSLNEYKKAEADFLEAISLEDFEPAHRNMVLLRILQDRSEEAIQMLTDRIRKSPENADNLMMMGDLMERIGQPEKARSWFEAAEDAAAKSS